MAAQFPDMGAEEVVSLDTPASVGQYEASDIVTDMSQQKEASVNIFIFEDMHNCKLQKSGPAPLPFISIFGL